MNTLKDPANKFNEKLNIVMWLSRKAMFYEIDQMTQLYLKLKVIMIAGNTPYVTFAHDNNIALHLVT